MIQINNLFHLQYSEPVYQTIIMNSSDMALGKVQELYINFHRSRKEDFVAQNRGFMQNNLKFKTCSNVCGGLVYMKPISPIIYPHIIIIYQF